MRISQENMRVLEKNYDLATPHHRKSKSKPGMKNTHTQTADFEEVMK